MRLHHYARSSQQYHLRVMQHALLRARSTSSSQLEAQDARADRRRSVAKDLRCASNWRSTLSLTTMRANAQASLRRIDREEQEALERARIVQASEETILALKQRYAAERERILNRLTDAERAQQEAAKASSDAAFGAIVDSLAVLGDKSKDAMDNFKRTVLTAFLDIAQAQLSVAIFGATAQEVATKGFIGLGTAAILAAILQGLFAAAKAAVQRGFKVGGWTGDGRVDDVAGIVHKREYVVPAPYAERYKPILELMRRGAYEPALVVPQQQRVRVVVDGQIDVRARDDWMDVARSITLRRRYAV